ncbi:MAG TPA: DUF488 domain-containing protein [Candidatus Saccharimonadaceae bacterium]|nr:DUF488 domain-containing protein [Candidatus Saccharimonadaceae bacterium]
MTTFRLKRIYEAAADDDGYRVLVDRVWPRGISKEKAKLDEWQKDIAPSTELRKWFAHDPKKYDEFKDKYEQELYKNTDLKDIIRGWHKQQKVTLLYGAHDEEHNQAVVLKGFISERK